MGAETTIYVQVSKIRLEWIEVQAVTMIEAMKIAEAMPGVAMALDASYDPPLPQNYGDSK